MVIAIKQFQLHRITYCTDALSLGVGTHAVGISTKVGCVELGLKIKTDAASKKVLGYLAQC